MCVSKIVLIKRNRAYVGKTCDQVQGLSNIGLQSEIKLNSMIIYVYPAESNEISLLSCLKVVQIKNYVSILETKKYFKN